MKQKLLLAVPLALLVVFNSHLTPLHAQGTAFTYQGRLDAAGSPANGIYDLQFALFDAASGGTQQSGTWTQLTQGVTNGLFTVELDFGSFFPGASRWLEIGVRTNGGSSFTTLTPRQKFTATPYAITAGNFSGSITAAQLPAGVVTNSASGVNLTGSFSGNGANVTNVNAATLGGLSSTGFWKTNGNAGANPTNGAFLGTTDNLPVEFRVNGARVLRLEPNTQGVVSTITAPNVIGGWAGNRITNSAIGATIWGGGSNVYENVVGADFGTVSGGRQNSAGGAEATVAGGRANSAIGLNSTVSGGYANTASGLYGTVSGGEFNLAANADFAAISGGLQNTIQSNAYHATIGGGANNSVRSNAWRGTVGGGAANTVGVAEGTVAGGAFNSALGFSATIGGGGGNAASGEWSTIAGGRNNLLTNADYATISGGLANLVKTNAAFSTIPGGLQNEAGGAYGFAAGRRAKASHTGAFVWADSTDADFLSTGADQFLIRATGGVGINNNNPNGAALAVNGYVTVEGMIYANGLSAASTTTPEIITPKIGTAGNVPLELWVNNQRAVRIEYATSPSYGESPNIVGGYGGNTVSNGFVGGFIGGGGNSSYPNRVGANYASVLGGLGNTARGDYSTAMGTATTASGYKSTAMGDATTASGYKSTAMGDATTASGYNSTAMGLNTTASGGYSTAMGLSTTASGDSSTAMGYGTTASSTYSTAMGFNTIASGVFSTAMGYHASANHQGSFVWADTFTTNQFGATPFVSTAANQFLIRATGGMGIGTSNPQGNVHVYSTNSPTVVRIQSAGTPGLARLEFVSDPQGSANEWRPGYIQATDNGNFTGGLAFFVNGVGAGSKFGNTEVMRVVNGSVGIGTNNPSRPLHVVGGVLFNSGFGGLNQNVSWVPGNASWSFTSDRHTKDRVTPVNPDSVLQKVARIPINEWSYIGYPQRHIGPMAQDFHAEFPLNADDKALNDADLHGVALAAIQGLNEKVEVRNAEIAELKRELENLKQVVNKLVQANN